MPSYVLLDPGEVVANRWRVMKEIGHGGFSSVYRARDLTTGDFCALKTELAIDKAEMVTKMEVAVLLRLRNVSQHACKIMGCGREVGRMHFVVMTLIGRNFEDLRRMLPHGRMRSCTVARLGVQCLRAIRDVHDAGFLHRDIKPTNFAMGRADKDRRTVFILDFGLARWYKNQVEDRNCDIRPPRESAGFRGTMRYSSVIAHHSGELGRQDDLWSLLYVLLELRTGALPWNETNDQQLVAQMKRDMDLGQVLGGDPADLEMFEPVMEELKKLRYHAKPDYDWFMQSLVSVQRRFAYPNDGPFEWEEVRGSDVETADEEEEIEE